MALRGATLGVCNPKSFQLRRSSLLGELARGAVRFVACEVSATVGAGQAEEHAPRPTFRRRRRFRSWHQRGAVWALVGRSVALLKTFLISGFLAAGVAITVAGLIHPGEGFRHGADAIAVDERMGQRLRA